MDQTRRFTVEKVKSADGIQMHTLQVLDDNAYDLQYNSLPLNQRVGSLNDNNEENNENGDVLSSVKVSSTICLPDFANRRRRSLAQMTREALPRLDFYRNSRRALRRPSLGELHGEEIQNKDNIHDSDHNKHTLDSSSNTHGIKLGWIQGVLIPCLLNIWGVMLFLRLSWIVAQAGIGQSFIIIGISAVVCVVTTLSLSAICTNGEVKGGGIYFIISRSLGPEFGASVGVVFAFANAVAASMNTIGFCDSLNDLLRSHGLQIIDGAVNDVRLVGTITLIIMILICAIGMEWESKAQNILVAIIVAAIFDFVIGSIIGPLSDEQKANGFMGFNATVFSMNWEPDYRIHEHVSYDFFSVFAIFFPSVTGIQAGANISGDLKDPASSIPKGTMLALIISMFSYLLFVIFAGAAAIRDASGSVDDLLLGNLSDCAPNCVSGLHNSYQMMTLMSSWGPLIYAGCFAATLSTALTNLVSVPRLIQALGIDRIYPGLIFFSKGYGKNGEPYRGYVLTFFVSFIFILIANLNMIAPLISNFYLASYALINFCTFHAALIKPLGWRPTFKYYNMWLSLAGFIMCVVIMFLIDWISSLITFIVIFALYLIVIYRKPDVNWGSSTQAQVYKTALTTAQRLTNINEHVKNYRPQILVLCGKPSSRPPLIDFANLITKNNSLLICGDIVSYRLSHRMRSSRLRSGYEWLRNRKIKAFYNIVDGLSLEIGAKAFQQVAGVGKLSPNVLMMGYKCNWGICNTEELLSYFNVLHNAFDNRLAVAILRLNSGLDVGRLTDDDDLYAGQSSNDLTIMGSQSINKANGILINKNASMMHADSNLNIAHIGITDSNINNDSAKIGTIKSMKNSNNNTAHLKTKSKAAVEKILSNSDAIPKSVLDHSSVFQKKQGKGKIDVWWLYDDGGLTMLLPYIVSTRQDWAECELRVFALANQNQELEVEERNMANLLSKFRIDYSSLQMVSDIMEKPKKETVDLFDSLIEKFRETSETSGNECCISYVEECTLQEKTNRQLRLRELLLQNSHDATLVVMSLPMPRKGTVSAPLYMAWLEVLTKDMPPFLLVRGNQSSVLTFYS